MTDPKDARRPRVASALREALAELMRDEVKDPRVAASGLLGVTQVDVNRDGSVAKVYVSWVSASNEEIDAALEGLRAAAGYLRGPLARKMRIGRAPRLEFLRDVTAEVTMQLQELVRGDEDRVDNDADAEREDGAERGECSASDGEQT